MKSKVLGFGIIDLAWGLKSKKALGGSIDFIGTLSMQGLCSIDAKSLDLHKDLSFWDINFPFIEEHVLGCSWFIVDEFSFDFLHRIW